LERIESFFDIPLFKAVVGQVADLPDGSPGSAIQLKAAHLPRP
jgi:hypothetical protein